MTDFSEQFLDKICMKTILLNAIKHVTVLTHKQLETDEELCKNNWAPKLNAKISQ